MQLQRLNSPLSFYNNPVPWPKIHPVHEDVNINNLYPTNQNNFNNHPDHVQTNLTDTNSHPGNNLTVSSFYEPAVTPHSISPVQHDWISSNDMIENPPGPKEIGPGMEQMLYGNNLEPVLDIPSLIHTEHQTDGILGNYYKTPGGGNDFMPQENHHHEMTLDFDCFKGILDGSNSWDDSSDSVDVQAGGIMIQDYETGYNNL